MKRLNPNPNMDDDSFNHQIYKRFRNEEPRYERKRTFSVEVVDIFNIEEIKMEVRCWNRLGDALRKRPGYSNRNNSFIKICGLCLAQPKELKWLIKFRKTGLRRMKQFLVISTRREVQSQNIKLLTWSCLSLISFYSSKHQNLEECNCFQATKLEQSKAAFRNAMYLVLPEYQNQVIKHSIKYITLCGQWNTEEYDLFVLEELLTMITKPEILLAKLIKQIEISQREEAVKEALDICCTLSSILEHSYWDKYLFNHLLHNCLNTLLKVYLLCSASTKSSIKIDNAKFRVVVKASLKYFISTIKDNKGLVSVMDSIAKCLHDKTISNEDRIEIMEMISFCAQRHHTRFYRESITPDMLELLLSNLNCEDKNLIIICHKILHNLLDRRGNLKYFNEPVYYFKGRSDFTINHDLGIEDIHFFKSFSKKFFEGIQNSFVVFNDKYSLITVYATICLVLVELPEPVITINIIHLIITTQNEVLKLDEELPLTNKSHVHAIVSALMSLICVVHQDEVNSLKRYVEEVVRFRTENSPHLLPPLQNKYTIATHHTTAYHDQLYFLEDEILYALQRCWLARRATGCA